MQLRDALRSTPAVRAFDSRPVPDGVLYEILDDARFAPSGGNRQGWRIVVVSDPAIRRILRDLYLRPWYDYLAARQAGLVPYAPLTDRQAEHAARARVGEVAAAAAARPGFAEQLDRVPALMILLADLRALAATDRDLDRYTLVGGASVYPFAWSILLGARERGLAGVMTTMLAAMEDQVRDVLRVPSEFAVAAAIALGYPAVPPPTRLRRAAVEDFARINRFDGPALRASGTQGDEEP